MLNDEDRRMVAQSDTLLEFAKAFYPEAFDLLTGDRDQEAKALEKTSEALENLAEIYTLAAKGRDELHDVFATALINAPDRLKDY